MKGKSDEVQNQVTPPLSLCFSLPLPHHVSVNYSNYITCQHSRLKSCTNLVQFPFKLREHRVSLQHSYCVYSNVSFQLPKTLQIGNLD